MSALIPGSTVAARQDNAYQFRSYFTNIWAYILAQSQGFQTAIHLFNTYQQSILIISLSWGTILRAGEIAVIKSDFLPWWDWHSSRVKKFVTNNVQLGLVLWRNTGDEDRECSLAWEAREEFGQGTCIPEAVGHGRWGGAFPGGEIQGSESDSELAPSRSSRPRLEPGWMHISLDFNLSPVGSHCSVFYRDSNASECISFPFNIKVKSAYSKIYSFETCTVLLVLTYTNNCIIITTINIYNSSRPWKNCPWPFAVTSTPTKSFHCWCRRFGGLGTGGSATHHGFLASQERIQTQAYVEFKVKASL